MKLCNKNWVIKLMLSDFVINQKIINFIKYQTVS